MKGRLEPVLFGAVAGALYVLLAADSFYKVDGIDIVRLLDTGGEHPWHTGFLPALGAFRWLLELVGLAPSWLQLGAWFSAAGAAVCVACARAGMGRLGVDPRIARFSTALFLTSPLVLAFATVVEFHGPMLGPLGVCFWWLTVQVRKPSWGGMAVLGALCHLPFLLHSQQLLFPVWLLAFFVLRRGIDPANLGFAAVAGAVHAALFFALPTLLPGFYGYWADLGTGLSTEASIGRPQSLDYTPQILWQEWLWPWFPFSVLVFLTPFRRAQRREFAAFLIGFVPYLWLSVRQLVFEPEFGAYMLPMALPAAMLIGKRLGGRPVVWVMLVFNFVMWNRGPAEHLREQRGVDSAFAANVAASAGDKPPFVLVGSHRELGAAYARLSPGDFLWVRHNAALPREQATPQQFAAVEFFLRQLHAEGRAVLITDAALRSLDDPRGAMLAEKPTLEVPENEELGGPLFADHLREKFDIRFRTNGVWPMVPK